MANQFNVTQPFDGLNLEIQARYLQNGLTYVSNNNSIHPRDEAGNIILNEAVTNNPLLIIEPNKIEYTTRSVIRTVKTNFEYFKFPVATTITDEQLDLNIDQSLVADIIPDVLLKLPVTYDSNNQPITYDPINTSYDSVWYSGNTEKGLRELPWIGDQQITPNSFTLTKSTIDLLKQANKTLKFTIKTQFRAQDPVVSIDYDLLLQRTNIRESGGRKWKNILFEQTQTGGYPYYIIEYVLDETDMQDQDTFKILVQSGNPAWSLNDQAYWEIKAIDLTDVNEIDTLGTIEEQQRSRITYLEPNDITVTI